MPVISVIIPVYNAECYLAECVDSILHQTFTDFELLLIDDGSTDNSLEICKHYAAEDSRVKMFSQTNAGQSCARNRGLDNAKGDYIAFIDADDVVSKDYLRVLYDMAVKSNARISSVNYSKNKARIISTVSDYQAVNYTADEAIDDTLYQKKLNCSVWGKLIDKKLFQNIRFKENIIYEDLEIMMRLYECANAVAFSDLPLYFYRETPGSSLSVFSPRRFSVLDVVDDIYDRYAGTSHRPAALDRRFSAYFNMLVLIARNGNEYGDVAERCHKGIIESRFAELKNPHVRLKNKVGALVSYLGLNVIKLIAKKVNI